MDTNLDPRGMVIVDEALVREFDRTVRSDLTLIAERPRTKQSHRGGDEQPDPEGPAHALDTPFMSLERKVFVQIERFFRFLHLRYSTGTTKKMSAVNLEFPNRPGALFA